MRTLSTALRDAQRRRSRKPYMNVEIAARFPGIRNLIWTNLYTGVEPDADHDAAISSDWYITRLRVGAASTLYRNHVDTADDTPDWTYWKAFRNTTRLCAIAQNGLNLYAFAVDDGTPTQIYMAISSNGGLIWGGWVLVITHTNTITTISAAAKTNGDLCVIVNDTSEIAAYRRLSSVWQAKVVSSISCTITGLCVRYEADWNVIATGDDGTDAFVGRLLFGDGYSQAVGTWSSLRTIADAVLTANIAYSAPFYGYPDIHRVTFRETYSGTVAYDRIMTTTLPAMTDFVNDAWREPIPLMDAETYGLAITSAGGDVDAVFLTSPGRVDSASLVIPYVDATDDVILADLHETDIHHPSLSKIVLDNAHGRYNTLGSGDNTAIRKGAQVRASPGYYTPDYAYGPPYYLYSTGPTWWIVGIDRNFPKKGGSASVTLHLADAWSFFARWVAPTTYVFDGTKNCFQLWRFLLARLGFEIGSFGSSPTYTNLYPLFTVTAGTSMLSAARRLFRLVPDLLLTRTGHIYNRWCQASDATAATGAYAYHHDLATQHEISAADYRDALKDANHQRVFCGALSDILGEALDYDDVALFYASARHHSDPNLTVGSDATTRAESEQRKVDIISELGDRITTPVHCGVELYDVIELTDERIGLSSEKRRVLTIHTLYRRDKPTVYEQTLTLGAP